MKKLKLFKSTKTFISLFFGAAIVFASCTDVDEQTPSSITADQFFQTEEEFISALGDAYTILGSGASGVAGWGGHGGHSSLQEVSSDEVTIARKGQDWFDGGIWIDAHRHTIDPDHGPTNATWVFLFAGVTNTNRLIGQFETLIEDGVADPALAEPFIAELRVMRAFYYYWLVDTFGNVPIVDSFEITNPPSNNSNFQTGRTAVFDFIDKELTEVIADGSLSEDVAATYGRANRWVAHFILMKLYLNAEVYTGQERWQDAADQAEIIMNPPNSSPQFSLTPNYFDNFVTSNTRSPEFILAVPYDEVFLSGFNLHQMTLHYGSQATFQLQMQPWNGYATLEEFYNSYDDEDVRKDGFIVGLQRNAAGEVIEDPGVEDFDPDGPQLINTPEINELEPNSLRQAGARIGKFEFANGSTDNLSNDFPIFRYSDVLLSRAEALWRLNPASGEALTLVNQIRQRAGLPGLGTLTADDLLAERGKELFYEIVRRQDLIRFDGVNGGETRFNDPWWEKGVSESFRNVFPIPRDQIEANPNLNQNPGY